MLKTFNTVYKLGKATATQIAEQTKKARAVESASLKSTFNYELFEKIERFTLIDYNSPLSNSLLKIFSGSKVEKTLSHFVSMKKI